MIIESRDPAAITILIVLNVTNEAGVLFQSGLSRDGEVGMPVHYYSLDEMVLLSVNWVLQSSYSDEYTNMRSSPALIESSEAGQSFPQWDIHETAIEHCLKTKRHGSKLLHVGC